MRPLARAAFLSLMLISLQAGQSRACTSFCLETPDGPVFGSNMDLFLGEGIVYVNPRGVAKEGFRESTAGETAKWVSRYGSVTFSLVGREFAWSGMNEVGLVMSTMQLMVSRLADADERIPFDSGALLQYVLDTCSTVEEAIETISLVRLVDDGNSPSHYLLADATGSCAALEHLEGELVRYTGDDLPIKALANATYESSLAFADREVVPPFNPGESVERVAAAAAEMDAFHSELGVSAVDYALRILTETVVAPKRWWSDWFDEPYTRWSVAYDIAARKVYFRTVESKRVKHLSLDSFDLSCTTPLLMLDVNAELEGNVERFFTPYDHDINLKVFRDFCDRWEIEISAEDAVGLMRFFEGFECEKLES